MKLQHSLTITLLFISFLSFSQEFIKFRSDDGKVGLKNVSGKIILEPKYDYIYDSYNGYTKLFVGDTLDYGAPKRGVFGIMNSRGKIILEPKYNFVYEYNKTWARVFLGETHDGCSPKNGSFGFIDTTGKEVIPIKYKRAEDFYHGIAKVNYNEKVGFIDSTDEAVIPFNYDHITGFYSGIATTFIGTTDDLGNNIDGKYGLIDYNGNVLAEPIYDQVSTSDGFIFAKTDNMYGILKNGKVVVPFNYFKFYGYHNGAIIASRPLTEKEEKAYQKEQKKREKEDGEQEQEQEQEQDYVEYTYDDSEIIGKFGVIDTSNNIIVPFNYDNAFPLNNNLIIVKKKGKYGIINEKNKTVLDFDYDIIFPIEEGNGEAYLRTKTGTKYGCIDNHANVIAESIYDQIDLLNSDNGFVIVTKGDKKGCINSEGKLILPIEYDSITIYDENTFSISIGDEYYKVDANNNKIEE